MWQKPFPSQVTVTSRGRREESTRAACPALLALEEGPADVVASSSRGSPQWANGRGHGTRVPALEGAPCARKGRGQHHTPGGSVRSVSDLAQQRAWRFARAGSWVPMRGGTVSCTGMGVGAMRLSLLKALFHCVLWNKAATGFSICT